MHAHICLRHTVKPACLFNYCDSHRQKCTFVSHLVSAQKKGLDGKPQHSTKQQKKKGNPITHITILQHLKGLWLISCFLIVIISNSQYPNNIILVHFLHLHFINEVQCFHRNGHNSGPSAVTTNIKRNGNR